MTEAITIGEALQVITRQLRQAGMPDAHSDAAWMLVDLTGHPRAALPLYKAQPLTGDQAALLREQTRRRLTGEPLQYILGSQDFMGLPFRVDSRVLIPRPETELLCELAISEVDAGAGTVLDLCCGSGCIGVTLAKLRPKTRVWATDKSPEALAVALENAERLSADVTFLQGDLLAPAQGLRFDLIVCNPPYIPTGELAGLAPEVRREPTSALDGGADGLAFYRRIAAEAPGFLQGRRVLLLEVGHDQATQVAALCAAQGARTWIEKDLRGIPRFVKADWREGTMDV